MANSEDIRKQIEDLQKRLHEAEIMEGKVNLAQEVKHRILELVPDFPNIEYVLWPLRVAAGESSHRRYSVPRVRNEWNPERDSLVEAGAFDELIGLGFTMPAIRSRASRLGYLIHGNAIVKKEAV